MRQGKQMQTQVNILNAPGETDWVGLHKQWVEGVGGAQKLLPMHIVYEYCSKIPFEFIPDFTKQPARPLINQFSNLTRKDEYWFPKNSK
jgi:hypothetical protein